MIIIDEAHYASTDSNRADLAKDLQEKTDSLLLQTATPHSGNPEHFFKLLNLIDPFMFTDPAELDRPDARQRVDKVMIRRGKETIFELNYERVNGCQHNRWNSKQVVAQNIAASHES